MSEKLLDRIDNLNEALDSMLSNDYATLLSSNGEINVVKGKSKICSIEICEECYWIKTSREAWREKTTYSGTIADGVFSYSVDSLDECVGEIERIIKAPDRIALPLDKNLMNLDTNLKVLVAELKNKYGDTLTYIPVTNNAVMKIKRNGQRKVIVGVTSLSDDCFKLWNETDDLAAKIGPLRTAYMYGRPGNPPDYSYKKGYRVKGIKQCIDEIIFWVNFTERV